MKINFIHYVITNALIFTLLACSSQNEETTGVENSPAKQTSDTLKKPDTSAQAVVKVSLENADSAMGKRFFIQCQACHTLDAGGENLIGPNLWGIMGRAAGKHQEFQYSAGLAEADFSWNLENLNQFLTKPNDLIAETTMIFNGIADEKMRRDLLAYMLEATTEQ